MQTKGKWQIQNLMGISKTFASSETDDARAWMRNRGDAKQAWNKASNEWEAVKDVERKSKKTEQ